jgi:hypothetical protein
MITGRASSRSEPALVADDEGGGSQLGAELVEDGSGFILRLAVEQHGEFLAAIAARG